MVPGHVCRVTNIIYEKPNFYRKSTATPDPLVEFRVKIDITSNFVFKNYGSVYPKTFFYFHLSFWHEFMAFTFRILK